MASLPNEKHDATYKISKSSCIHRNLRSDLLMTVRALHFHRLICKRGVNDGRCSSCSSYGLLFFAQRLLPRNLYRDECVEL